MIRIYINKKSFKGTYRWEDITLKKYTELAAIPFPEGYADLILADGNFTDDKKDDYINTLSSITEDQLNESFPAYYRKVIETLSDIPAEILDTVDNEKINELYEDYFKPFVISLIYHLPVLKYMGQIVRWEPQQIRQFRIKFTTYYVPESVMVLDQIIPFYNEPVITYSEACDLVRGNQITKEDVKRLALFMSIYCRKKNEKYSERKALERQELMMTVPMSTIWSVFFYTLQRLPDYSAAIRLFGSLQKSTREAVRKAQTFQNMEAVR